ncbi:MAG: hypothetical protein U0446_07765 [Dehalococcoidia bacterium]
MPSPVDELLEHDRRGDVVPRPAPTPGIAGGHGGEPLVLVFYGEPDYTPNAFSEPSGGDGRGPLVASERKREPDHDPADLIAGGLRTDGGDGSRGGYDLEGDGEALVLVADGEADADSARVDA